MEFKDGIPPGWFMFVVMFIMLSTVLGLMILVVGIKRTLRGESFFVPREGGTPPPAGRTVRSRSFTKQFSRTNSVRSRSALPNAETPPRSAVQPFSDRSNVRALATSIAGDIPTSIEEVQRLAHTIALYTKRPNKELAILEAWGATKGEGDGYTRASRLFDAAMSDTARQVAKAKAPPIAREVETA